jgi:3-hydroxyacyl-CoA dehydrogenase
LPRLRDIKVEHPNPEAFLQSARDRAAASASRFPAPLKCIDAVSAAITKDFAEGLKFERGLFMELVRTPESRALRHAFFGERAISKIPDMPGGTPARAIKSAAVVGAGSLGARIATSLADAGIAVTIVDANQEALDKGLAEIRKNIENMAAKGKPAPADLAQRLDNIRGALSCDDIVHADIVFETVTDDLESKERVFRMLDQATRPGTILATCTSSLDVNRIADFTGRPQDVIGLHFVSPDDGTKLLEILRGDSTATDVLATAMALAKKMKKTAVVSRVRGGFISSRMLNQYFRQAGRLLEEGVPPEQVDQAIEDFGFAMGPLRMSDIAGNDIGRQLRGGAAGKRAERRDIGNQEIVERLVYALVNEGARLLEEGVAVRASDIDMIFLKGYGFPLFRGGPMFYADTVGLQNVVAAMDRYAGEGYGYRDAWTPAPLLARLAAEGGAFN